MREHSNADYYNLDKCKKANQPLNIIIGGRGTGKTFRLLTHAHENNGEMEHFMYLRRTEVEISSIADVKYNPFKAVNRHHGWNVEARYISKNSVGEFYERQGKEEQFLGYASALSTFGKLRGADLCDVDKMIFDEFIKSKVGRPIPDEADLFFNAYETINRNRELEGRPPLKAYLLSNSTTLNSPILEELGLVTVIEKMKQKHQTAYTDPVKGIHIELLDDSNISKEKADTALYRFARNTTYASHALDNEFAYDSFENICKVKLNEFTPWVQLDDLYIYRHKSRLEYYVCTSKAKCQHTFTGDSIPLFKRNFGGRFYQLLIGGYVFFANIAVKQKILSYYK